MITIDLIIIIAENFFFFDLSMTRVDAHRMLIIISEIAYSRVRPTEIRSSLSGRFDVLKVRCAHRYFFIRAYHTFGFHRVRALSSGATFRGDSAAAVHPPSFPPTPFVAKGGIGI